jgi:hypothetical protein
MGLIVISIKTFIMYKSIIFKYYLFGKIPTQIKHCLYAKKYFSVAVYVFMGMGSIDTFKHLLFYLIFFYLRDYLYLFI